MMKGNGEKYKELIEAGKKEKTVSKKVDIILIMLTMMAVNDLDAIYNHIDSIRQKNKSFDDKLTKIWIGIIVILLVAFFSNGKVIEFLSFLGSFIGKM